MSRRQILGRFCLEEKIGEGRQAKIWRATDERLGIQVALRLVLEPSEADSDRTAKLDEISRELFLAHQFSHPNKINVYYCASNVQVPWSPPGTKMSVIAQEYAKNGELLSFLNMGRFGEEIARTYTVQMLSAISACHSNMIFHRDIKPDNIMLDDNFQLKLGDFGLAIMQQSDVETQLQSSVYCGTQAYMCPELLAHHPYSPADADVWALITVTFMMLCNSLPFGPKGTREDNELYRHIKEGRHESFWMIHQINSPYLMNDNFAYARNFINSVFVSDPSLRHSLAQVMNDEWIKSGPILSPEELKIRMTTIKVNWQAEKLQNAKKRKLPSDVANTHGAIASTNACEPDIDIYQKRQCRSNSTGDLINSVMCSSNDTMQRSRAHSVSAMSAPPLDSFSSTTIFSSIAPLKLIRLVVCGIQTNYRFAALTRLVTRPGIEVNIDIDNDQSNHLSMVAVAKPTPLSYSHDCPIFAIEFTRLGGGLLEFHALFNLIETFVSVNESLLTCDDLAYLSLPVSDEGVNFSFAT